MDIQGWMEKFTKYWKAHDIDGVMNLFHEDVQYFETPHRLLNGLDAVRQEWEVVSSQNNIELNWQLFMTEKNKHAVIWNLTYAKDGKQHHLAGTYLVVLSSEGKCTFFHHTGEKDE